MRLHELLNEAGYSGYSKSNNAVDAESSGRFPLSIATKKLKEELLKLGIKCSSAACKQILKDNHSGEWHHSSKMYNIVKYYDVKGFIEEHEDDIEALKQYCSMYEEKVKDNSQPMTVEKVWIKYPEWGGTLRSPKLIGYNVEQGELKGNWVYLPNGSKKKKDGNNVSISFEKDNPFIDNKQGKQTTTFKSELLPTSHQHNSSTIKEGDRVHHHRDGDGTVLSNDRGRLKVKFDNGNTTHVMDYFVSKID